jgi:hypothetical protein
MTYQITVESRPTYLHATGSGPLSQENARRFLLEAYLAAVERNHDSLLLEMKFSGHLGLPNIYSVITERSADGALLKRIAYVDGNLDLAPEAAEFAALTAVGRGVNVQLFQSLAEAEHWLSTGSGEG